MRRERRDEIWEEDWRPGDFGALAARYAEACDGAEGEEAARLARDAKSARDLWKVRAVYHAPPAQAEAIPLDADPHLAGFWRFDQESGTTARDSSKHGRDGKLVGGLSFDRDCARGRYGWALRFAGGDGCVEVTGYKGVTGPRPRTVAAWIRTDKTGGEIVSWGEDEPGAMWTVGTIRGRIGVVPKGGYLYMNDQLNDDAWHHVAVVVEEAEAPNLHDHVRLYQDGEPATIHDIGLLDLWPLNTGKELDVRIGRGFRGLMDDVRIYDRPLSAKEISALYQIKRKSR
jgi:hypothetical protein